MLVALIVQSLLAAPSGAVATLDPAQPKPPSPETTEIAATCKQASSCREAVEMWCGGYTRADGDHDGIPCENVCHSKKEVDEIKQQIGC